MRPNPQFSMDLVTFAEKILCSESLTENEVFNMLAIYLNRCSMNLKIRAKFWIQEIPMTFG